jgi:hypothetical protein
MTVDYHRVVSSTVDEIRGVATAKYQNHLQVTEKKTVSHAEMTSCVESYRLFKRCSSMNDTEGISCSAVVKGYLRCALDGC